MNKNIYSTLYSAWYSTINNHDILLILNNKWVTGKFSGLNRMKVPELLIRSEQGRLLTQIFLIPNKKMTGTLLSLFWINACFSDKRLAWNCTVSQSFLQCYLIFRRNLLLSTDAAYIEIVKLSSVLFPEE